MQKVYTTGSGLDEFAAAREQFDRLVNQLRSTATTQSPHGEVEKLIWSDGMEVLRRLFQGHLNRRAIQMPLEQPPEHSVVARSAFNSQWGLCVGC